MRVIEPSFDILMMPDKDTIYKHLELAARNCYKSEDNITENSAEEFLERILKSGHESIIEHICITVRIVCDRGVLAELTRHRLASFSVESTRYANYSKDKFGNEITVIRPFFFKEEHTENWHDKPTQYQLWLNAMQYSETTYLELLKNGATPQEARSVLPNSLKTDIIITANLREWLHIFNLRCSKAAHPQIRQICIPLLKEMYARCPVIFEDMYLKYCNN